MRSYSYGALLAASFAALLGGCNWAPPTGAAPAGSGGVKSLFSIPTDLAELDNSTFFDMPWPCDLRKEFGFIRLEGYTNPQHNPLLDEYVTAMKGQIEGFSPAASGFLLFGGSIDTSTLPTDPKAAAQADSSVQLIDVDPASPERGTRRILSLEWRETAGVYWPAHTLAFMPALGFPLRPHNTYALVVTDKLKAADGGEIERAPELDQIFGLAPATGSAVAAKATLDAAVAGVQAAGVEPSSVIHFTSFTTSDPTKEMFAIRDSLKAVAPAPTADATKWAHMSSDMSYEEYVGWYGPSPNFQQGNIPYASYGDGGQLSFVNGVPVVHDLFDLRFSLMIPSATACPMPPAGYPIVLYAHGTGGDYRSYVSDGTGDRLAQHCVATMGIDEIFHGVRPGAPPGDDEQAIEVLFFNLNNIDAARTNTRQAAADEMQRARLFTESHLSVPASVSLTHSEILLDASKLMFFGHSQGGLNGPLYLAADDSARGGVLSGSSADISITLLEKTSPPPSIKALVTNVFLGLSAADATEVDFFHPAISLAQTIEDVVDPVNYARFTILEPRPGFASKSIYMTEGINPDGTGDTYAPPDGIEAHAMAMGLPTQLPEQRALLNSEYGGAGTVTIPPNGLGGNMANGAASGILAQWAVPPGDDGHFVVFDVPGAEIQSAVFVKNLGDNPQGLVPPP